MSPEPSYLVGRYGEIKNEIDNLECDMHAHGLSRASPCGPSAVRHARTRAFPVLTLGSFDTWAVVPPEPSYLAGRYGEIEHAIDNLDNLTPQCASGIAAFYHSTARFVGACPAPCTRQMDLPGPETRPS